MVFNIIVNYCCARVLKYAKMLNEAKTEETRLFCHIFIIGSISWGRPAPPPATPMILLDMQ